MNYSNQENYLKNSISSGKMSVFQSLVVFLCFMLNFNDGIDVLVVSFTGTYLETEWGLSKSELGYIFSAGLAGMTAGCFLLAPFGDKIGRRKIFIIALALISMGMLWVYFANSFSFMLVCRFVTGLGIGCILPNLATVASEISNQKRRDFNVGIVQAGWPLGAILTGFFTAWAVPEFGWRFTYLSSGIFSLIMLILVYFFMPESLMFLLQKQPKNALKEINKVLKKIAQSPLETLAPKPIESHKPALSSLFTQEFKTSTILLWSAIFFGFLTLYTLLSWVPNIAKESGMPFEMATYIGTCLNLGAFTGVFVMGLAISKYRIQNVFLVFMILAFTVMVIYGNLSLSHISMFVLTFFIGFFVQGGFNTFYPTATRIYPENIRSTGVGMAMGFGRFGAILGPTIFGWLTDAGFSIGSRFIFFSIPLLISAFLALQIPKKNFKY